MQIDFFGLEAFLNIVTWGSFKRAATQLDLSQAALSHRLKKLEDDLGTTLLTRSRQITLTPAGAELLPVAERLMTELTATFDDLRSRSKAVLDKITFGSLPTVSSTLLPSALATFKKSHPDVFVQTYDNSAEEIARRVRDRQAEFGVSMVSTNSMNLDVKPLARDPFVLVCPEAHPLSRRTVVDWRELEGEPLIRISAEAGNRQLIDDALRGLREKMTWRHEVQRVATALGFVQAGLGLTIVPRLGLSATRAQGFCGVPLRHPSVSRVLGIIRRRDENPKPSTAALIKAIGDAFAKSDFDPL